MGRLWLIVRAIHLPIKRQKEKRLDIKDTDCIMVSHHNQGNQSLNVKDDFKDDLKVNPNYLESSDDDSSDSEKKEKNKNKNKKSSGVYALYFKDFRWKNQQIELSCKDIHQHQSRAAENPLNH